ncbi:M20/M25/M40 family metallo-hydrolase [Mongoliibacter ruber]|uniref:Acetylornithine deacetylase/succinyl-diaminopimelate desuccinylase-like protein n=1 Tax=Mongoliibacter ruber TaxID=1750599 RepID=A0A2T0WL00_9BACT|nr:M20/M25/M40 family metallo-hydrolase [Mongoliibacter ruber]PRY87383.1 acetylornithine deacetylase/succinyl-diaminopimelate desuccinylase-like protein [Mongoliibacter ruber]
MKKTFLLLLSAVFLHVQLFAQNSIDLKRVTEDHFPAGVSILNEILSMPNDSNIPEQLVANVAWCKENLENREWTTKQLETSSSPLLLGQKYVPNAQKTVLFYFHIDGQPVDRKKWDQEDPYKPVLKKMNAQGKWEQIPMSSLDESYDADWRIFARSASDDKGPFAMFLTAWDAMVAQGMMPNYNVKVILDFEEEIGSPNLGAAVNKYKADLKADMMLIMDGPRHLSNMPTISFGARGISQITLTTYGPRAAQHSGHYGNYAPNPAFRMSQLLASMKDDEGRVTIPGYYDGINLTQVEKDILAQVPDDENEIKRKIGIGTTDKVGNTYQESLQYPSLNIRGLSSGWVGDEVRTIVPADATAEIDIRLVPESDPERLFALIRKHIEDQGYHILDAEPTDEERVKYPKLIKWEGSISYQAFRTPFDSEPGIWLNKAYVRAFGEDPIRKRISGGSLPIAPFVEALDNIPAVTVTTVNSDNNQHGPNENIRLGNYKEGILTALSILTQPL